MKKKMMVDIKNELQEMVDKMYQEMPVKLKPKFPYVLVRVLPRHRQAGLIYLPVDNNKVVIEGIVLDVFNPFWKQVKNRDSEVSEVLTEASVKPGEFVLFNQWEGVPVEHTLMKGPYYKSKEYLLVAADPVGGGRNGILGTIEREEESKLVDRLISSIEGYEDDNTYKATFAPNVDYAEVERRIHRVLDKYVYSHIDEMSVTQSGERGTNPNPLP